MRLATFRKLITSYTLWKHNDVFLNILSKFLVECIEDSLLKKFNETQFKSISGNSYYLEILNNNKVLIGLLFSENNPQEIIIDKKNIENVIINWLKIKKENADEIAVTANKNNKVFIIGRSLTDEEKLKQKQSIEIWRNTPTELKNDKQYCNEFQKKWRSFTVEEIRQLEQEFYIATIETVS